MVRWEVPWGLDTAQRASFMPPAETHFRATELDLVAAGERTQLVQTESEMVL